MFMLRSTVDRLLAAKDGEIAALKAQLDFVMRLHYPSLSAVQQAPGDPAGGEPYGRSQAEVSDALKAMETIGRDVDEPDVLHEERTSAEAANPAH